MSAASSVNATTPPSSVEASSPIGYITPFNYLLFLATSLLLFLGYLILPRGVKAHYCGAARRRYRRQTRRRRSTLQKESLQQNQTTEDILGNVHAYSYSHSFGSPQDQNAPETPSSCAKSEIISDSIWGGVDETQQLPLPQQLKAMLQQPPGVKLIAHGTKCRPRPVYLTLHSDAIISQYALQTPPE